mgnify:CR=1 FL=1
MTIAPPAMTRTRPPADTEKVYFPVVDAVNLLRDYASHDFLRDRYVMNRADDEPAYRFELAIGARHPAAEPTPHSEAEFEPKVKLELKRAPTSGGCG